ncbi:MAG: hypothetical protein M3440_14820 [Chloroflexota bacterium]|nr:hypothetical protein [Chloroflexota bacterium]
MDSPTPQPNIRTVHISELKQDLENARRHNPRNVGQIERSISTDGFGRSGLLAEDLTIAAGNATADASVSVGMEEVIVVDSDGTRPVYVRRTDLKSGSPEFRRLALADNRSAELAEWDAEVLQSFMDDGLDLERFWFPEELAQVLAATDEPFDPTAEWAGMPEYESEDQRPVKQLMVSFRSVEDLQHFAQFVGQSVTMSTKSIWFPERERERLQDFAYAAMDARE